MSNDLLDADCVLRHLQNLKIISMRLWKDSNLSDHDFSVYFDNPEKPGDVRLQIIKRNEKYYIPRSIIGILSCRHSFDSAGIYTDCSIKAA